MVAFTEQVQNMEKSKASFLRSENRRICDRLRSM